MNTQSLIDTARKLVADDKGLLAMDESTSTCNKRFAGLGIPQTEDARCAYKSALAPIETRFDEERHGEKQR